jgi:hypothetical protein
MFPWVTGFQWTAGHIIFLGLFYTVILVVVTTFALATLKARRDLQKKPLDAIRWELDFEELPAQARVCRHELTGEVKHRVCHHNFECGTCDRHADFELVRERNGFGHTVSDESVYGFTMPADRLYHRGHTWARAESDGTMTIGLDDMGRRVVGTPDAVELPAAGTRLLKSGTACRVRRGDASARFLSPVDGEVVEARGSADDWTLRLKPLNGGFDTRHLLRGQEVRPWVLREMERLQMSLTPDTSGLSLADGGAPVEDFPKNLPHADWDKVWGEMFLEP